MCHDVPIARTGTMEYAAIELPNLEDKDGVIEIERSPEEVFRSETIASFEGKPVTLDHPYEPVTPENWQSFAKGHAMNVRRGDGDQDNLLLADLLITDRRAIDEVRAQPGEQPLREVSCGYDAEYEQVSPGRGVQRNIVGNHIALVKRGRCGPVCSIGDSHMAKEKKPARQTFADKLRKLFNTRDTEGFEQTLSEIEDEMGEGEGNGTHVHVHLNGAAGDTAATTEGNEDPGTKETNDDDPVAKVVESVNKLTEVVTGLVERVGKLESDGSGPTNDEEKAAREEKERQEGQTTGDSAALKDEFQDSRARAEILAPGINLPTYDAKADSKKTIDGLCALRRRALTTALEGPNADLVKAVTGDADVSKLTCDSAKAFFNAASELVKRKNATVPTAPATPTNDEKSSFAKINETNAAFWAKRT